MARSPATPKPTNPGPADVRFLALHGPESAVQKEHLDALKAALQAKHGDLQVFHFDGKSAQLAEVFDELRGYSLMGGYKLVVIDPADDFVETHREPLERYAQNPVDHATLALRATAWHPGKLDKLIAKVGQVIKCEPPKPAEAVARLVKRAADVHGLTLERPAAQLLVDRLGVHVARLESELDKLAAMVSDQKKISRELIEASVERSSDEKAWEAQDAVLKALAARDVSAGPMIQKVRDLLDVAGNDAVPVAYAIGDLARKLAIAGQMLAAGESEAAIGRAVKLWPPSKVPPFMAVLRKVGGQGGAKMLDLALTSDARSKSGFGEGGRNLESLCVTLADVAR